MNKLTERDGKRERECRDRGGYGYNERKNVRLCLIFFIWERDRDEEVCVRFETGEICESF